MPQKTYHHRHLVIRAFTTNHTWIETQKEFQCGSASIKRALACECKSWDTSDPRFKEPTPTSKTSTSETSTSPTGPISWDEPNTDSILVLPEEKELIRKWLNWEIRNGSISSKVTAVHLSDKIRAGWKYWRMEI